MKKKILMGLLCMSLLSGCEMTTKECDCKDACKNETNEEVNVTKLSKAQIIELINNYLFTPTDNILDSGLTERTMIIPAINNSKISSMRQYSPSLLEGLDKVTDLGGSYKVEIGGQIVELSKENTTLTGYGYEDVNKTYQNLYGKTLEKKDYVAPYGFMYKYIAKEDVFVEFVLGTGSTSWQGFGVKEYKEEGNKVTAVIGYSTFTMEDENKVSNKNGLTLSYDEISKEEFGQTMIDKYSDKIDYVEVVFEEKDGDYVLVSVTKK